MREPDDYRKMAEEIARLQLLSRDDPEFDLHNAFAMVCRTFLRVCQEIGEEGEATHVG